MKWACDDDIVKIKGFESVPSVIFDLLHLKQTKSLAPIQEMLFDIPERLALHCISSIVFKVLFI